MAYIVGIVGWHNSGKTALGVSLVGELKRRGLRVAVVKHAGHAPHYDQEGSDSWRYVQAGSDAVALASAHQLMMINRLDQEPSLEQVLQRLPEDVDVVLVEGYKAAPIPKVEVKNPSANRGEITREDQRLALLTAEEDTQRGLVFDQEALCHIADLICQAVEGKSAQGLPN